MRQIDLIDLSNYTTEARGLINRVYLHWSGGFYDQAFPSYHINIKGDGSLWTDMGSLTEVKSHTWFRNTGAVGVCLDCCEGARLSWDNEQEAYVPFLGSCPPTKEQLNMMAKVIAKLCYEIGFPINEYSVMTHDECARNVDGGTSHPDYGVGSGDPDMRWDLYGMGDEIREKANYYYNLWSNRSTVTYDHD